ncbi:MAG: HAD hydrolase family protein, partial [Clostridia bacterium]|nr:HAD hydrolase family protein [Clostridia bacterium]
VAYHFADVMLVISREDVDFFERILGEKRPIYKAVIHFEPNGASRPAEDYKDHTDFQYVRSTHFLFEIISHGTGKGVCAGLIRDMVPKGTLIVGIGDYENDVSLLEASDLPVAVDGGWEPLKQYARWVAPPIEEHPIAWLVKRLEQEISAGHKL